MCTHTYTYMYIHIHRWNYRRMSLIVAYIFYKNILQSIANFYFAFT